MLFTECFQHWLQSLPVVLGLQELKFVFDPVAGLCHSELEARLPWLVGCLKSERLEIPQV